MKCTVLKIWLTVFAVTTVRRVCLVDQLAFSSHEYVYGNFPLVVLDFKQIWKEWSNLRKYQSIMFHENLFGISRVFA